MCIAWWISICKMKWISKNKKNKRPAVVHVNPHQRSLPTTQAHYPTTEDTVGFCLLCCQPEPVPLSLSTRTSQLTPRCPCGVPTWSGQAINVARRTWWGYRHFIDQLPLGWQEGATPPSWWTLLLNLLGVLVAHFAYAMHSGSYVFLNIESDKICIRCFELA